MFFGKFLIRDFQRGNYQREKPRLIKRLGAIDPSNQQMVLNVLGAMFAE
ncbi:MAG: hypothetical protein KAX40_02465 [Herpetosiphon sp.]|nr:hypothetical protein [Herpetosiphon sp.]